jgi:hypothetical protein
MGPDLLAASARGVRLLQLVDPAEHSGPVDALYIWLVIVATLGLGDIAPAEGWLRVVAPWKPWWASPC